MEEPSIYKLIEQHYKQIELFYYQNQREISRPKTRYIDVVVWTISYVLLIIFCVTLNIIIEQPFYYEAPVSAFVYSVISEVLLKVIGIKVVECYQHYAKEETRRKCLCVPSCSEYAILCFKKYEFFHALFKIIKRVFVTCKGVNYIIDNP